MTDKQLDEFLRKSMAPTEMPPELPLAPPRRSSHKKVWLSLVAACLCLVVSAAVVRNGSFGGFTSKDSFMENNSASSTEAPKMSEMADGLLDIMTGDSATDSDDAPTEPSFTLDRASPLYRAAADYFDSGDVHFFLLGETESFVSVAAETEEQTAFFTMEKQTQRIVDLAYLLSIPGMEPISSPITEPDRFGQAEVFLINKYGELQILMR